MPCLQLAFSGTDELFASIRTDIMQGAEAGLQRAGNDLGQRIRESFETGGSRDGSEPWIPTTNIALRNRVNPPTFDGRGRPTSEWHTLIDTGNLRSSIWSSDSEVSGDTITVEVAASAEYARDMQEGGEYKGRPVPPRPFMFLTEQDIERVVGSVFDSLPGGPSAGGGSAA